MAADYRAKLRMAAPSGSETLASPYKHAALEPQAQQSVRGHEFLAAPPDPKQARQALLRWRTALAQTSVKDPGNALDRPDRELTLLKIFGETHRLADLCTAYPATVYHTMIDGSGSVMASVSRDLTSLNVGRGGADTLHHALSSIKERADIAIAIAEISETWSIEKASAVRCDFAERICETVLNWLIRAAHRRGEFQLSDDISDSHEVVPGIFIVAGGDFAHQDLLPLGVIEIVALYDPDYNAKVSGHGSNASNSAKPNSTNRINERALVRIGAELREAIEGPPGGYPLYHLHTPFGSKLNGSGLVETTNVIAKRLAAPQSEELCSWLATARIVAGDRVAGGNFFEKNDAKIWGDHSLLTDQMIEDLRVSHTNPVDIYRAIAKLCRLTIGRTRPSLRTATSHQVIESAGDARLIARIQADRLLSGNALARNFDNYYQIISGSVTPSVENIQSENNLDYHDQIAALNGFMDFSLFRKVHEAAKLDAQNSLELLISGPYQSFRRYRDEKLNDDIETDDFHVLQNLGFQDGAYIAKIIDGWLEKNQEGNGCGEIGRVSEFAPGLLTDFGQTQYPMQAIKLFDALMKDEVSAKDRLAELNDNDQARQGLLDALGCFPKMMVPLVEHSFQLKDFYEAGDPHDIELDDENKNGDQSGVDLIPLAQTELEYGMPCKEAMILIGNWRDLSISQIAFMLASRKLEFSKAAILLYSIQRQVLIAIYEILRCGPYQSEFKKIDQLVLLHNPEEWDKIAGDKVAIAFVLASKKPNDELKKTAKNFVTDYIHLLENMKSSLFKITVDVSRRPLSGQDITACDLVQWSDYIQSHATSQDQVSFAHTHILTGSKIAQNKARDLLRTAFSNSHKFSMIVRDIKRQKTQHYMRNAQMDYSISPWDFSCHEGGYKDIELIVRLLIHKFSAQHPALQDTTIEAALHYMAEANLINAKIVESLIKARQFWMSMNVIKYFSGISTPEETPIRTRMADLFAEAAQVDHFDMIEPLMCGFRYTGTKLYSQILLGQGGAVIDL